MNKKKLVVVIAAVMMILTIAIGGTLAYFTDAEQQANTFTVGNISIDLQEKMYDAEEKKWVDYTDNQILYPTTIDKAAFNKAVRTYNDSPSKADAYIRTIVTCPAGLYDYIGLGFNGGANQTIVDGEGKTRHAIDWTYAGDMEVDGELKSVFVCTVRDKAAVKYGDYVLSLTKVWLYDTVTQEQIDVLGLDTAAFQVKVLSQGIQTYDLTHDEAMAALGEVNSENLSAWFN